VIDSGIDTHNELLVRDWVDFSERVDGYKPMDNSGHGTSIAGVIWARINGVGLVGIASDAELYSVKVLNSNIEERSSQLDYYFIDSSVPLYSEKYVVK
jgi:subtilisin family serine protease